MNVRSANKLIHGLNQLAEAATTIGAALEDMAWDGIEDHAGMPGERPIAAARLENPASVTEAVEELPMEDPPAEEPKSEAAKGTSTEAPVAESAAPVLSLDELRGQLADISHAGHTDQVRDLIRQTGVEKLSEVAPEHYGWLLAKARELV
ncbi:hypothetical protein BSR28_08650 [Boudabousia liubingyangii]|uniref:hypothetical protein n=1 Tax=Boudabousia liubingyangii TaxID=1921764 RepID=UPI00093A96BD|nr:hypothetical protein [Boudabousia liubingyangii]OKL45933.1 hypothetical protein BSR28_08650 [Boudabousia liubingyangii]